MEFRFHLSEYQKGFLDFLIRGKTGYFQACRGKGLYQLLGAYPKITIAMIKQAMMEQFLDSQMMESARDRFHFRSTVIKAIDDEILYTYWIHPGFKTAAVVSLATEAYSKIIDLESDWRACFYVLGDALQDAGCTDKLVLNHCYEDVYHCRGCWLLETLRI